MSTVSIQHIDLPLNWQFGKLLGDFEYGEVLYIRVEDVLSPYEYPRGIWCSNVLFFSSVIEYIDSAPMIKVDIFGTTDELFQKIEAVVIEYGATAILWKQRPEEWLGKMGNRFASAACFVVR